jgi:hypothetical protein
VGFFGRLGRRLLIIREAAGLMLPIARASGEIAPISLTVYRDAYIKDPSISAAVDYLAEQAVGVGFFVTSSNPDVKKLVEEFNAEQGMDQLLMQNAKECVFGGNSFLEKVRDNEKLAGLKLLPLTSIRKIKRDPTSGRVLWYEQSIGGSKIPLEAANIVHFRFNPQDGEAFGSPVIRSLLESYPVDDRYTRESLLKIKAKMETIMPKIFERYASPKSVWVFTGASDNKLNEYKTAIEQTPQNEDLVFNPSGSTSFDIKTLAIDPRARFEGFVNYIESQTVAGMQTPVVKLYTAPGFTEASATVAKEISERKIEFLRRFFKRVVEREIYADLLESNGFDPIKDRVVFNWGVEKPELSFENIIALAQVSAQTGVEYLSKDEVRRMLRKFGFEVEESQSTEVSGEQPKGAKPNEQPAATN